MSYYNNQQLQSLGFKKIGKNVKISDKASIYNTELMSIGDNSRIDDFCVISGLVEIGRNVHVAPLCLVAGGEQGVFFGDFSGLAYHVQIFSQSDDYLGETLTNPTVPSKFKKEMKSAVRLERHVIVGAGTIILPGVTVAEGCSIGALSLVNKSTDSWGVYIGNPARRVKERKKDLLILEQRYLEEFNTASV